MTSPTTTMTPYGTYTHGTPTRVHAGIWPGSWARVDTWTSHRADGPQAEPDRLFAASLTDDSPVYGEPSDPTCSCCWLGFGHTSAAHTQRVQVHAAAGAAHAARQEAR